MPFIAESAAFAPGDGRQRPSVLILRAGGAFACEAQVSQPKRFAYILKSLADPTQYYTGVTSDPRARLITHNEGASPHTAEFRPWRTLVVIEFDDEEAALEFERYLKTGSGREFARRHFRQTSAHAPMT